MATINGAGQAVKNRSAMGLVAGFAAAVAVLAMTLAAPTSAEARQRRYAGYAPAYSAIVIDAKTGQTLHAEAPDAHRFPASVTKVMTLYLLFEQIEAGRFTLQSPLRVSAEAAAQPPSKIGVRAGSTITVEEAIRALVTKSANDVAVVIAENISGTEEAFGQLMTRRARAIGMSRTTFRNASGLPDAEQMTTARDLATLGRAIQDHFPRYWRYFQTYSFAYRGVNHRNHNRLLGRVEGVDGIKTGYTRASGFNLLTSARRGDRQIVAVVMGGRTGGARDARMRQLVETVFPRAYAGARTAPVIARAADPAPRQPQRIAVAAQVAVPGRGQPVAAPAPITPMAAAVITAGQTRGGASTGASAAAPVTASAQPHRQVIQAETAPPPAAAAMLATAASRPAPAPAPAPAVAPGNPNPRPGVLGTISNSQLTTASVSPRPVQMASPGTAPVAEAAPRRRGEWSIQLGAFPTESAAQETLQEAREATGRQLGSADPYTEKVEARGMTLVRARFAGFDRSAADAACRALKSKDFDCIPVRN
ncbi:D-alanyl-D-alanine carboxypeptidase [Phreatobacter oligotrophus]|uniref:D-alanyl-D-alanine carboxypeptidase n=1 Tax=Phreatobacter oligotrophus TaxID=1122261 RepID=A0A2T4Z649_9HYPH|nr:D-alanyl-D-alanine carboxypeptidase [Phreatobacter oligotrophus]PTM57352.1 D-alanyl-D-alanine carboxypeptidase [Phreatobacter oligotrophus]